MGRAAFSSLAALVFVVACSSGGGGTRPAPAPAPAKAPNKAVQGATPPPVAPPVTQQPPASVTPPPASAPTISPNADPAPGLPPIPSVTGAPLKPTVVYPPREQLITSRDSNFVIGSIGSGDATLQINGVSVPVRANGSYLAWLPLPPGTAPSYRLVARRGSDSAVLVHPVRTFRTPVAASPPPQAPPPDPRPVRWVSLGAPRGGVSADTDRTISVRPVPSGTYKWFAIPGTVVERVSALNGFTRIRLDSALDAYVDTHDVTELLDPGPASAPHRVVANVTVVPDSAWTDVVFPLRESPMYLVEEERDKLVLTLYSTRATTDIISYKTGDSLVRAVTWEPVTNDRVRYTVHLRGAPYGYLAFHDGRNFILRVRKPPVVNRARPLEGITISVDPGHPPIGATGPTGLYEGDATLGIGMALKAELEQRGARVLMTRTTLGPVDLGARPVMARRANAHAFISIHLNALTDGINPLVTNGSGTYFFQPQSEPLARAAQAGMVRAMGLRDLGVFYDNLAVVRTTWMPAILCEGAFVIVPEQEAAMRDPEGQRVYARGVANGIEAFFAGLAK